MNFDLVTHGAKKRPHFINNPIVNLRDCWLCLTGLQMISKNVKRKGVTCTPLSRSNESRSGYTQTRVEKDSHSEVEKGSSFERRLIWFRKSKGFQVSVREGISLGSITVISCVSTDSWSLSTQVLGSRSWTLVTVMVCCYEKPTVEAFCDY